ncbi:alkaline phosphatase D family protein [Polaribacter sp. M15]
MIKIFLASLSFLALVSCNTQKTTSQKINTNKTDFTIAFGSCNKQYKTNILWKEVIKNKPNLWIWGGDNIYADTYDMDELKQHYRTQMNQKGYKSLLKKMPILATWDDHDYGVNDSGAEYEKKKEAQQLFLDFIGVSANSSRRKQEGIYHSQIFKTNKGSIKVIVLDTRYFRTSITKALKDDKKRYTPNTSKKGTILGETQWNWLQNELSTTTADFNIIVSSIQVLSSEHGFETWGNFPHEVEKLKKILTTSKAKNVLLLSGDRHISEFSKTMVNGLSYPLIDFTSSGLTHSYTSYSGEPNTYRIKNVISEISFGLLKFNFKNQTITMEMRGKDNILQQKLTQMYD